MNPAGSRRTIASLVLLGLFVFAVTALAGPGRIDIVDGQTRYEVARSMVDHGDHEIRDPNVEFPVFPGRDGDRYTTYRFPHTALGVAAILAADVTGPVSEGRRHFFFVLAGAACAALLAMALAWWFLLRGRRLHDALVWAALGVFCTPSFFYATSTFDDIIGTAAVVGALAFAVAAGSSGRVRHAVASGLLIGLAFNAKEPLGIFVLPALAAACSTEDGIRLRWSLVLPIALGTLAGLLVYAGYDLYKFPPGTRAGHAEITQWIVPRWTFSPLLPMVALAISPAKGALWYCPPVALALVGMYRRWDAERPVLVALLAAVAVFVVFVSCLTYFAGDPAWGPRYLTPVFALFWVWVPDAFTPALKRVGAALVALGLVVQLLALSLDPHRLYIRLGWPTGFYLAGATVYFFPQASHLLNRPGEIVEVVRAGPAERYTPAQSPTYAFPIFCFAEENPLCDFRETGPDAVARYHVLNGFRPWWSSFGFLPPHERPVDITATALGLAGLGGLSLIGLLALSRRRISPSGTPAPGSPLPPG